MPRVILSAADELPTAFPPPEMITCSVCRGTGGGVNGLIDPARLAVLSDALEEAGCPDETLLAHLRSPGPHVRGCWVLDLVLGKE